MQKILRSPASMRRKPLKGTFGVPLSELVQIVNGHVKIPIVVEKVVEYIESKGLNQEGIFRINGSTKAVDKMKAKFDKSQDVDLDEAGDIMAVAGLLKLFLRELPDPIMTKALHQQFINLQRDFQQSESEIYFQQLKNLVALLPEENFHVLAYLCRFLVKVTDHQEKNKMNSRALSIVFGPNLFRCSDGVAGLQEQVHTNVIVRNFIENYDFLFGDREEKEDGDVEDLEKDTSPLNNSKRIVVKPATEKKSPPVKPVSYEQYIKDRIGKAFAKREGEEKDVNSNSLEKGREEMKQGFDRQGAMSPCDVSSADERALSPFNLDSDSTVPSPIVSDSAIEVVDRAIKECVSEHLFGSPEEKAPVPTPRTKRLQKKQKEAASRLQQSQENLEISDNVSSVTDRVRQFSIDSQESLSPPITPLAKTHPDLAAFRFFETQGMMLQSSKGNKVLPTKQETKKADKELNNTNSPGFRRKLEENSGRSSGNNNNEEEEDDDEDDDLVFDEEDLKKIERAAPVLSKVTGGRVPPPRLSKNTKKKKAFDAPPEEIPTQLTELDLDSVQRDGPILQKLTEGRVQPPRVRMRSGSIERSDPKVNLPQNQSPPLTNGNIKQMPHDPKVASHNQGSPQKPKLVPHGTQKALAEAAVASRLKKQGVDGVSPSHPSQEEEGHLRKGKHSDKRHDTASESLAKSKSDSAKERSHHDVIGSPKRKGKKKTRHSGKEENDLRVRDIDSPELGVTEHKHGKKKSRSTSNPSDAGQDKLKAKLTNGKDEERSRSASPRIADVIDNDNLVPSLDLSSLHANAESDEPIPAWPLHQRADWLNNMEELTIDVKEGPVEKLSSATIEADRTEDKPMDKAQNIKQLTRQVRNLKRKIRQYEEEYCEQHGHKPSTAEKVAEPEVKKMMRELKKAAKQLKAAKEQSEDSKKPLHSTLPSTSHHRRKQDDSNSESSLIESLRDALDLAEEWLKEKRREAGRMDDIFEMTKTEVHDEKVSIQKVLLQLENKYGRPTTRETKEIMKPLYDRYRNLKRLIAKFEVRRTLAEEVVAASPPDLNTIDEHEETKEFTPKQLGTIHTMYNEEDLEPCMVTQEIPSGVRGLPSRTLDIEEGLASPVDLSGRADSPLSPDSSANFKNLADASLSELIKTQNQALADKKKVRRILKEFEDNFFKEKGRKVQKEDRGPMEEEYNEYKRVKKELKLLEALMEKHQSQANTGVT